MSIRTKRIVRWILFLPVAIIASTLVYPIVSLLNLLFVPFEDSTPIFTIATFFAAGVAGSFTFIWVGTAIAPGHKFAVAVTLSILNIAAGIFVFSYRFFENNSSSFIWHEAWTTALAAVVIGVYAIVKFSSDKQNHRASVD